MSSPIPPTNPGNPNSGVLTNASAEVVTGPVTLTDNDAKYTEVPGTSELSIFTDYQIRNYYHSDKHRYAAGVTSPTGFHGASVAIFQLASPTLVWVCDWTACRWNQVPEVPDPDVLADGNWVLLDEDYQAPSVQLGPDGVLALYRISGTYVYAHKNPNADVSRHVAFGRPPYMEDSLTNGRILPVSAFQPNLSDTTENEDSYFSPSI